MEHLVLIGTILAIHIFAWLTPGPNFIMIMRNSLVYSRKTGIWTAAGCALGNVIHVSYSVAGIGFIVAQSNTAFTIIKYLGVAYLLYLGIKTLCIHMPLQQPKSTTQHTDISAFHAIKIGFLTNTLSPKAPPFFISIFATVFAVNAPLWVLITLVILMPLNTFFMASILAIFFSQKQIRSVYNKWQRICNTCLGSALILLAGMIALA